MNRREKINSFHFIAFSISPFIHVSRYFVAKIIHGITILQKTLKLISIIIQDSWKFSKQLCYTSSRIFACTFHCDYFRLHCSYSITLHLPFDFVAALGSLRLRIVYINTLKTRLPILHSKWTATAHFFFQSCRLFLGTRFKFWVSEASSLILKKFFSKLGKSRSRTQGRFL